MAGHADPLAPPQDDPSTSDAVSLHTITDADDYTAHEREEALGSYADEPVDVDDNVPLLYQDDSDAERAVGDDTVDAEAAVNRPQREHILLRILRKIFKVWLCYIMWSTVVTLVFIVVITIVVLLFGDKSGNKQGSSKTALKEAAWVASGSQDYSLNLVKLYPALDDGSSSTCKQAWQTAASSLPCHRMILSQVWDHGNATEAREAGADPVYYNRAICTPSCESSLKELDTPMSKTCADRSNHFDFDNYGTDGQAYFESQSSEEGPADVSKSLLARYDQLCSGPKKRYIGKTPLTCAEELWLKWGILDGKEGANLNGLDTFREQTSVRKTIPETKFEVIKVNRSGQNSTLTHTAKSRRVGPGKGETQCGDCLIEYLRRKAMSFRQGLVLKPGTRTPVGFADFAARMTAMERCSEHWTPGGPNKPALVPTWNTMGWWCNGKGPCHEDEAVPPIVLNLLHGYPNTDPSSHSPVLPSLSTVPADKKDPILALSAALTTTRCAAFSLPQIDQIPPLLTTPHVLSRLCSPRCLNTIDRITPLLSAAHYPNPALDALAASINTTHRLCHSAAPISFTTSVDNLCAAGYAHLNLSALIDTAPSSDPAVAPLPRAELLATFTKGLEEVARWNRGSDAWELMWNKALRHERVAASACNTCTGEVFIGREGEWNRTVEAFKNDGTVNSTEYVQVAREGWRKCARVMGLRTSQLRMEKLWDKVGLGRIGLAVDGEVGIGRNAG